MTRITDRIKQAVLPTLATMLSRTDSADNLPPAVHAMHAQHVEQPRKGGLENVISGLGTARARSAGTRLISREQLSELQLDDLLQHKIPYRIAARLPGSSLTDIKIAGLEDPEALLNALDELGWVAAFRKAATFARHYGGAAVWMVCDGGGEVNEPLDYATLQSVNRLIVMNRFELHRTPNAQGEQIDSDPYSDSYMTPELYRYQPATGVVLEQPIIHASRLIRFYGDPVPPKLLATYQYWGAPVMEGILEGWEREEMAAQGGAEVLHEIGGKTLALGNLSDLLTNDQGRSTLISYMALQQRAFSMLRMWIVGPGQVVTPHNTTLSGWSDVYDRQAQKLAALADMPVVELWGQAPGGLSTDDASGRKQWAARCRDYQRLALTPALNQLIKVLVCSALGPTDGDEPERWVAEWSHYEVESQGEKATTIKTHAEALSIAVTMAAMTPDEARGHLRQIGLSIPDDVDDDASSSTMRVPASLLDALRAPTAPAQVEEPEVAPQGAPEDAQGVEVEPELDEPTPPSETAMNGAQVASMLEIITMVNSGLLTYDQGVGALGLAFQLDASKSSAILGPQGGGPPPAAAPASTAPVGSMP